MMKNLFWIIISFLVQSVENVSLSEKLTTTSTLNSVTDLPNLRTNVTTNDEELIYELYNVTSPEKSQTNITGNKDETLKNENIFNEQSEFNITENSFESTRIDLEDNITAATNTIRADPQARVSAENDDNYSPAIGPGESAGILAGVVVLIGIVGYVGFVVWRRYLQ